MAAGSEMEHRDFTTSRALEVKLETLSIGSSSNASDAFSLVLISAVRTLLMNG